MDFSLIIESLPIYFQGLWTTVWLVSLSDHRHMYCDSFSYRT